MTNLMDIHVIKTNDGWMVECNDEYVEDANGDNLWDSVVDALAALKDHIQVQKEFYAKYGEGSMTTLEKAQRYAMGECLEDNCHKYSYEQACKIVAYPETNEDQDGYTIIFPRKGLEDADLVLIMDMMVKAYMEGAK